MNAIVHKIPVLRALLPLISGILVNIYLNNDTINTSCLFLLLFLPVAVSLLKLKYSHFYRWVPGIFITISFVIIGFYLALLENDKFNPAYFLKPEVQYHKENIALVMINEPLTETERTYKATAKIKALRCEDQWCEYIGNVLLYFEKTPIAKELSYGDLVIISTRFNEIQNAANPYQFDYKKYLFFRKIYHNAFVSDGNWVKTSKNKANPFMLFIYNLRISLLSQLADKIENVNERSVASALLLGHREEISHELRASYAASGAMHILAVSGLHVGIVFLILNSLLSFLNHIKYGVIIKSVLIILILWVYACLTGLSPSVSRAATMFSFVVIGLNIRRITSVYNSICISAFCLILFNPYIITYVGFQLSYAAVLGIVFLQPKLYKLYSFKNKLADWAWSLTTVSIAAQLATLPLAVLYFNQLPVYFIITNFIAIPAATIIIGTGFSYFVFCSTGINLLITFSGEILNQILSILNLLIIYIHKLPVSHLGGLHINTFQCILLYIFIIVFAISLIMRNSKILLKSLLILLFLSFSMFLSWYAKMKEKQFVVHSVRQETAISLIGNKEFVLISKYDSLPEYYGFNIQALYTVSGVKSSLILVNFDSEFENKQLILKNGIGKFYDIRFAILKNEISINPPLKPFNLDYLILTSNIDVDIEQLKKVFSFKKLIFDASNFPYKTHQWMGKCEELKLSCYNVHEKGAFVKKWK